MDTLNQITAIRQYNAQTDRTSLYDPISPYAEDDDAFSDRSKGGRGGMGGGRGRNAFGGGGTMRGAGPSQYYGRTGGYFQGLRVGRGPNQNLAAKRSRGGGMGGMGGGMGGMGGMGMGGPR